MSNNTLITEYLIHAVAELRVLRESMPDRRERIATAAMQGLLAKYGMGVHDDEMLDEAVEYADRLIARLDKEVKP